MEDVNILRLQTHYLNQAHKIFKERDVNGKYIKKSDQKLCGTVKEVLEYATNQGIFYVGLVKRDGGKISQKETVTMEQLEQRMRKRVYIFGMVNISRATFVVQEHPNNGQPLDLFQPFQY